MCGDDGATNCDAPEAAKADDEATEATEPPAPSTPGAAVSSVPSPLRMPKKRPRSALRSASPALPGDNTWWKNRFEVRSPLGNYFVMDTSLTEFCGARRLDPEAFGAHLLRKRHNGAHIGHVRGWLGKYIDPKAEAAAERNSKAEAAAQRKRLRWSDPLIR